MGEARILVVDDEPSITDAVSTALRYEGFDVTEAGGGRDALKLAGTFKPDLIVLDVMLPDVDGLALTRRLRNDGIRTPILFLTVGGDDYMTKPFSLAEVVARVRAILRRTRGGPKAESVLTFGDLVLDEETHEVRRAGVEVHLTATEFNLLRYFMLNPRRVLSKAQILDHVWDYDFNGDYNVVETFVSYLRKKLDRLGPPLIHTIRLVGYSLRTAD
jgi:two-component system OmpR family response regulator